MDKKIRPTQKEIKIIRQLHSLESKIAEAITSFSGSMTFVYIHITAFFLFFIFRPLPVEFFNIFLSLEAVFLATFIMITQNRQALEEELEEIEEEREQEEEEREQEELEEEVEDIQKDLDDIKNAMQYIQEKLTHFEKTSPVNGNATKKTK